MKKVFLFILVAIGLAACERTEFEQLTKVSSTGTENGYEYVDMGTSVMWATCNVGTSTPNTYGNAYAWGEIYTKNTFNADNYSYYADGNKNILLKYNTLEAFGNIDNLTTLEASDDVATQQMGGAWRMPTKAEQDELRNNCTWTWTTQNGVEGSTVTGPNGNSIFLPAAGYMYKGELVYAGEEGYYWSSSVHSGFKARSYHVYFYSNSQDYLTSSRRDDGQTIRPVCE